MTLTRRLAYVLVAALGLLMVGAYLLGVHNTERANWHTVTVDLAHVAGDARDPHRLLSIDVEGWTYAIEDSVQWIDEEGVQYSEGWPGCLEPRHPGFAKRSHEKVSIRFAEVSVNADGFGWRPVLMVDCRGGNT